MIRVLIVDDSLVVREHLQRLLTGEPDMMIVGLAKNGEEAVTLARQTTPDVITMDLNMPRMSGIEATRCIMEATPVPIVVVSSNWNPTEMATTFEAMTAGAVAVLEKPLGEGHSGFDESAKQFVATMRTMAGVKVMKRWARHRTVQPSPAAPRKIGHKQARDLSLVAIGASIGGPPALQTILTKLEKSFRLPVVICQHIAPGFLQGLVDWLSGTNGFAVHIAAQGDQLLPGHAYVAPDFFHMGVDGNRRITLSSSDPECGVRPSVSHMLRAVARIYGSAAVGVLLTGMGRDGAQELKLMKDAGAVTIAQDKQSSVVHGMPGEAIGLGAAMYVMEPVAIAEMLNTLAAAGQDES